MKTHIRNWWSCYVGAAIGAASYVIAFAQQSEDENFGVMSVFTTTNFVAVEFSANPCPHPGCGDAHNYAATERYMIIRDTWAEVVGTGTNRRLHSETNEWGSLTHQIAHPAVYKMHTEPGHPVRPGTRWPNDMPPLPPWEAYKRAKAARRSNAAYAYATNGLYGELFGMSLKAAARLTNTIDTNQYGVLYNVTTNYPSEKLVLEKRATDRLSGVRVWSGDAVIRMTNLLSADGVPLYGTITQGELRFRAVPATNELPGARRFRP